MHTPLTLVAIVLLALGTTAFGCELMSPAAGVETPFITTDRDVYEAEIGEMSTTWYVELTVPMTYTNRSETPVWITSCGGDYIHPPRLERRVNGSWETAYEPPHLACGGPSIELEPGEALTYEFRIRGFDPESHLRVQPTWRLDGIEGVYRINWWDSVMVRSEEARDGWANVPLSQRVSNPFRITGSLP